MKLAQMLLMAKLNPEIKFTHSSFLDFESIQIPNKDIVIFEDGHIIALELFWTQARIRALPDNWSIKE